VVLWLKFGWVVSVDEGVFVEGFCGFVTSDRREAGRSLKIPGFSAKSEQENVEHVYTFPTYEPNFGRSAVVTADPADEADPADDRGDAQGRELW